MPAEEWRRLVQVPPAHAHVAIVYDPPDDAASLVAAWIVEPLREGGGAIMVGTSDHAEQARAELRRLGLNVALAESEGRLVVLDAHAFMSQFMRDGTPDGATFSRLARDLVRRVRSVSAGEVRAWGEMVDILRHAGNADAAQRLEELWNAAIEQHGIQLLCTYSGGPTDGVLLHDVREKHTHVLARQGGAFVA